MKHLTFKIFVLFYLLFTGFIQQLFSNNDLMVTEDEAIQVAMIKGESYLKENPKFCFIDSIYDPIEKDRILFYNVILTDLSPITREKAKILIINNELINEKCKDYITILVSADKSLYPIFRVDYGLPKYLNNGTNSKLYILSGNLCYYKDDKIVSPEIAFTISKITVDRFYSLKSQNIHSKWSILKENKNDSLDRNVQELRIENWAAKALQWSQAEITMDLPCMQDAGCCYIAAASSLIAYYDLYGYNGIGPWSKLIDPGSGNSISDVKVLALKLNQYIDLKFLSTAYQNWKRIIKGTTEYINDLCGYDFQITSINGPSEEIIKNEINNNRPFLWGAWSNIPTNEIGGIGGHAMIGIGYKIDEQGDFAVIVWDNGKSMSSFEASYYYNDIKNGKLGKYLPFIGGHAIGTIVPGGGDSSIFSIVGTPSIGNAPLQVSFNYTYQPDDNSEVLDIEWNFGDASEISNESNPVHTFTRPGEYTVSTRITDSKDNTHDAITQITVLDPNDIISFSIAGTPDTGEAPLTVQFSFQFSSSDGASVSKLSWDFGDGSDSSNELNPSHEYTHSGIYTVKANVTDSKDRTRTATCSITVNDPSNNNPLIIIPDSGTVWSMPSNNLIVKWANFVGSQIDKIDFIGESTTSSGVCGLVEPYKFTQTTPNDGIQRLMAMCASKYFSKGSGKYYFVRITSGTQVVDSPYFTANFSFAPYIFLPHNSTIWNKGTYGKDIIGIQFPTNWVSVNLYKSNEKVLEIKSPVSPSWETGYFRILPQDNYIPASIIPGDDYRVVVEDYSNGQILATSNSFTIQ